MIRTGKATADMLDCVVTKLTEVEGALREVFHEEPQLATLNPEIARLVTTSITTITSVTRVLDTWIGAPLK